jgi:hypothetical protein
MGRPRSPRPRRRSRHHRRQHLPSRRRPGRHRARQRLSPRNQGQPADALGRDRPPSRPPSLGRRRPCRLRPGPRLIETQRYVVSHEDDGLSGDRRCPHGPHLARLKFIATVKGRVETRGTTIATRRLYISATRLSPQRLQQTVCGDWGLKNNLYWVLDVVFGEDQSGLRKGHGALNMASSDTSPSTPSEAARAPSQSTPPESSPCGASNSSPHSLHLHRANLNGLPCAVLACGADRCSVLVTAAGAGWLASLPRPPPPRQEGLGRGLLFVPMLLGAGSHASAVFITRGRRRATFRGSTTTGAVHKRKFGARFKHYSGRLRLCERRDICGCRHVARAGRRHGRSGAPVET